MKHWIHEVGHKGQEVRRLQRSLRISDDGIFGPKTEEALKDYQLDNKLIIDGRSGPQVRDSLSIQIYSGIDVSHHNGDINWSEVKASGMVDFVWVKISEGETYQSPKFKHNVKEARRAGIPVGGYHFGRPDNNDDPFKEVENFVKHCDLRPGDLRPVFDFERERKGEPLFTLDWCHDFMTRAELEFGVMPILYTGGAFLKYKIAGEVDGLENYILWHAYYPKSIKEGIRASRLYNWPEWRIWQWTARGTVPGITGTVDRNWLAGGHMRFDEITVI